MANSLNSQRILIIGGAGFIGSHLVQTLLNQSLATLTIVDEESHKISPFLTDSRLRFFKEAYQTWPLLDQMVQEHDVVISLAALCNPELYVKSSLDVIVSNYEHPTLIANACLKHQKWLIHFSSSESVGRTLWAQTQLAQMNVECPSDHGLIDCNTPYVLGPLSESRWCYAAAKQLMERRLYAMSSLGLPWTIIRPFNFVGPQMDYIHGVDGYGIPRVMAQMCSKILSHQAIDIVDGGDQKRIFTDIEDAMQAILLILKNPQKSHHSLFHIGNPHNECSIIELANHLENGSLAYGYQKVGRNAVSGTDFYGPGYADSDRRLPNISNLIELGWQPRYNLAQTLQRSLDWFISHYQSKMSHD